MSTFPTATRFFLSTPTVYASVATPRRHTMSHESHRYGMPSEAPETFSCSPLLYILFLPHSSETPIHALTSRFSEMETKPKTVAPGPGRAHSRNPCAFNNTCSLTHGRWRRTSHLFDWTWWLFSQSVVDDGFLPERARLACRTWLPSDPHSAPTHTFATPTVTCVVGRELRTRC